MDRHQLFGPLDEAGRTLGPLGEIGQMLGPLDEVGQMLCSTRWNRANVGSATSMRTNIGRARWNRGQWLWQPNPDLPPLSLSLYGCMCSKAFIHMRSQAYAFVRKYK